MCVRSAINMNVFVTLSKADGPVSLDEIANGGSAGPEVTGSVICSLNGCLQQADPVKSACCESSLDMATSPSTASINIGPGILATGRRGVHPAGQGLPTARS